MSTPSSQRPDADRTGLRALLANRRTWAVGAVALIVLCAIALAMSLGGDQKAPSAAAASTTPGTGSPATTSPAESSPSAGAAPTAAGPTVAVPADLVPPSLAPVGLQDRSTGEDGVAASITTLEAIQGEGRGPGNISGPALRVTVRIDNGTGAPVSLDGVGVELSYGADLTPASPLNDSSAAPFHGTVDQGGSATGVYVFSVPENARDSVTISVGYRAGTPYLVFRGSAA
jgi:hypothetical protein